MQHDQWQWLPREEIYKVAWSLTGFSLGNRVEGGGNLTSGPSLSSVEGRLKRSLAINWANSAPFCRHSLTRSSLIIKQKNKLGEDGTGILQIIQAIIYSEHQRRKINIHRLRISNLIGNNLTLKSHQCRHKCSRTCTQCLYLLEIHRMRNKCHKICTIEFQKTVQRNVNSIGSQSQKIHPASVLQPQCNKTREIRGKILYKPRFI